MNRKGDSWELPIEEVVAMQMPSIAPERCNLLMGGVVKVDLNLIARIVFVLKVYHGGARTS